MELGKNLVIQKDGTTIAASRSCSFSLQRDSINVSTKDSEADFKEYGKYRATISSEHLVDFSDETGVFSLDDALLEGTKVTASWIKKSEATGDISYSGSWIVTSFELSADDNSEATASISLESDGTITRTVAA
jgi:TP901-1 family phage major tail protein